MTNEQKQKIYQLKNLISEEAKMKATALFADRFLFINLIRNKRNFVLISAAWHIGEKVISKQMR